MTLTFYNYFINNDKVISSIIDSYKYLLESISLLIFEEIIHFNVNENNIVFNLTYDIPMLANFNKSLYIKTVNNNMLKTYLSNIDTINNLPFEVYVLYYIVNNYNENDIFKDSDCKKILEYYYNNNNIFKLILI